MKLPKGVYIAGGELIFMQPYDSMDENPQELRISIEDAGGGLFFAVSTSRWSMDSVDELIAVLKVAEEFIRKMEEYGYQGGEE